MKVYKNKSKVQASRKPAPKRAIKASNKPALRRKSVRASSDGSEMLNNLYELTKGMWFEPMDKFSDVVYNADEIIPVIDYDECVEFGTNNGQELLIYDEVNGRKHIRYSCSMTTIFDELVLTNVWDKSGQLYECDYDAIYDELAEKNNFNGDVDFSSSVRASYKPAPRKRAIRATNEVYRNTDQNAFPVFLGNVEDALDVATEGADGWYDIQGARFVSDDVVDYELIVRDLSDRPKEIGYIQIEQSADGFRAWRGDDEETEFISGGSFDDILDACVENCAILIEDYENGIQDSSLA